MSVSLQKSQYLYFSKTFGPVLHSLLVIIIAFNTSSLQSTHPHASAAELIPVSLSPTFPRHLNMYAFSMLAARQEPCHECIVFINIVYFICLEWRQVFADLKYRNGFPSLLSVFCTPLLTAKTGAGVCARPGASSWINMTLTAVVWSAICCLIDASFACRFHNQHAAESLHRTDRQPLH